jgi:trimethylamine--corrinoid protein Co-methyltransferase
MLDNELMGNVRRAIKSFEVNDDRLGLDAIARSIQEDNLLTDDHTMKYLRDVMSYKPKFQVREQREEWLKKGRKGMKERAEEKAKELMASYNPTPLDTDVRQALDEILEEAESKLHEE